MNPLTISIEINSTLYNRNPQGTTLGKKIIEHSVNLIDEIGLEQFTFKKLAEVIDSSEASIYRYFENKHQLFVYLLNWYWEWMIVRIQLNTLNIKDNIEKLRIIIGVVVDTANRNTTIEFVNEEALHRIVVTEGSKGYHHKLVDEDNEEGFFLSYKRLCEHIANAILSIQPDYPYPKTTASTLIETANNNIYFSKHLPRLTDLKHNKKDLLDDLKSMLEFLLFNMINTDSHGLTDTNTNRAKASKK